MEIIFGQFKKRQVKGLRCVHKDDEYITTDEIVTVSKWEEKESDVNIATHIVADAYEKKHECTVLMSNDTDLITPLEYIRDKLNTEIGIISPRRNIHQDLKCISDFQKRISNKILEQCQFPKRMEDSKGKFFCPPQW